MTLSIACPHCRARLQAKPRHVGKQMACPKCNQPFTVQQEPTAEPLDGHRVEPLATGRVDHTGALERALHEQAEAQRKAANEEELAESAANGFFERWQLLIGVAAFGLVALVLVGGASIWVQYTNRPPPAVKPVVQPVSPADQAAARAARLAAAEERAREHLLQSPDGINLGGEVTWERTSPSGQDAVFAESPTNGDGFVRWPINLKNTLGQPRLNELAKASMLDADDHFKRCIWSPDESIAFLWASDSRMLIIDVNSRTIKTVISTQKIEDFALSKEGFVVLQRSGLAGREFTSPTFYRAVPFFNILLLDTELKVRHRFHEARTKFLCAHPNCSWVYTNRSAIDLEELTVTDIVLEDPGGKGPRTAEGIRDPAISAGGEHLFGGYLFEYHQFLRSGPKLTWVAKFRDMGPLTADGAFIFGQGQSLNEESKLLPVFRSDRLEEPLHRVTANQFSPVALSADGRRSFYHREYETEDAHCLDLVVAEGDRTIAIEFFRGALDKPWSSRLNFLVSPSGRTVLVQDPQSNPFRTYWVEITDELH